MNAMDCTKCALLTTLVAILHVARLEILTATIPVKREAVNEFIAARRETVQLFTTTASATTHAVTTFRPRVEAAVTVPLARGLAAVPLDHMSLDQVDQVARIVEGVSFPRLQLGAPAARPLRQRLG